MSTKLDLTSAPVLDISALDAIRALDEDNGHALLQEILAAYCESSPVLLHQLDDAIAIGDADKAKVAAHTLKSSSANVGAMRLFELQLAQLRGHVRVVLVEHLRFAGEGHARILHQAQRRVAAGLAPARRIMHQADA